MRKEAVLSDKETREPRPLHPDRRVQRGLATLKLLEDREFHGDLDPRRVEDVEDTLDCHFPDNILSLYAANDLEALRQLGLELEALTRRTGRARSDGLDDDFVALGSLDDDRYVAMPREPEKDIADLFVFDASDQSIQPTTVANLVEECVDRKRAELEGGDSEERERADVEADELDVANFRVALFRPRDAVRKVRHSKFGVGTVVDEHGSGDSKKLEIEFDDGTRKILADYVDDI